MDFYSYFSKSENIVTFVQFVFFAVITILLFKKTGNVKYLENMVKVLVRQYGGDNILKGGTEEMKKYRTENDKTSEAQSFDNILAKYKLNKATGKLEQVDKVDLQEIINSCLSSCLQNILDKFLTPEEPPLASDKNDIYEEQNVSKDIDFMLDMHSRFDSLKHKYNLPEEYTNEEVLEYINGYSKALKEKISNNNGGAEDEKKETVEKSE